MKTLVTIQITFLENKLVYLLPVTSNTHKHNPFTLSEDPLGNFFINSRENSKGPFPERFLSTLELRSSYYFGTKKRISNDHVWIIWSICKFYGYKKVNGPTANFYSYLRFRPGLLYARRGRGTRCGVRKVDQTIEGTRTGAGKIAKTRALCGGRL